MKDRITTAEVEMEPAKVAGIAHQWAAEAKFTLHEKSLNRIVYIKKIRLTMAWLVIENFGSNIKLNAWIGAKNLGPDEKGSFWKGNKIPVLNGPRFGPASVYKTHLKKLLDMMESTSNNNPIVQPMELRDTSRNWFSKESLAKGFVVLGVIDFLYGALSVFNGASAIAKQIYPDFAITLVQNGVVHIIIGTVFLFCSGLLKNGKTLSIWLFGAVVLFNVGQDLIR